MMKEKLITGSTSFLEKKDEVHIKKMDIRMFVCLVCTMRENGWGKKRGRVKKKMKCPGLELMNAREGKHIDVYV